MCILLSINFKFLVIFVDEHLSLYEWGTKIMSHLAIQQYLIIYITCYIPHSVIVFISVISVYNYLSNDFIQLATELAIATCIVGCKTVY